MSKKRNKGKVIDFQIKRFENAIKKCQGQPGGATVILYKNAKIMAPTEHIYQALEELSLNEIKRLRIMRSVNEYLRKNFRKVMQGEATHEVSINVAKDITIWYANKLLVEEKIL